MPLLFSYGDLQRDEVQVATFGRRLTGQADELLGCERILVAIMEPMIRAATGKSHHANLRFDQHEDARVPGMVFEVTDAELRKADKFEAEFSYRRVVRQLASGKDAWVFAGE